MRSSARSALAVLLPLVLTGLHREVRADKPVVAVFDIQDKTGQLHKDTLLQLSEYLTNKVADGGIFQVVPTSRLKERLTQLKVESYKQCYDQRCQIEIGRELAARNSLATQIARVGSLCAIMTTLYDLRRGTSQAAASAKGGCLKDDLVASVEKAIATLKEQAATKPGSEAGDLLLKSTPSGAEVYIDGVKRKGSTPLSIPDLPAGVRALLLAKGDFRYVGKVKVVAGRLSTADFQLELTPEGIARRKSADERRMVEEHQRVLQIRKERKGKTIWGYTALGTAVAGAVTVGVLYGIGFSSRSNADEEYMASTTQEERDRHWADVEAADRMIIAGHVVSGFCAVSLMFALYELLSRPDLPSKEEGTPTIALSLSRKGLGFVGRFK